MALIFNGTKNHGGGPTRFYGASGSAVLNLYVLNRSTWSRSGQLKNLYAGWATYQNGADKSGYPNGYHSTGSWCLPIVNGGMSTYNALNGTGTITADAWAVKLAEAGLTGSGDLAAIGGLIVQLLADITGSGTITAANLQAFLSAVANLTGSGTASGTRSALGALIVAMTGSGTAAGSTITATGELDADITVTGTGLSTANVGQAVWSALAAQNNVAGTMGEKLNDAGSASNPWTEIIESGYTAAEILRIIAAVLAGEVSGAGSGTETFVGIDGATNRVVSTVDVDGNRTAVVLDGS